MNQYIGQLNESVDGLSLAYNEEANALSMSSEELSARVGLMEEQTSFNAALERQTEIIKEQNEVQMQLEEINALQAEWNKKKEEGTVTAGEHKNAIAELDEQEQLLLETNAKLGDQYKETEQQMVTASENAAAAIEEGNLRQITSYEDLEGALKDTFDNMKSEYDDLVSSASDAFDRMNDESKVSAEEMISNLEHNQKMTKQWGENHAKLMEEASKEGNEGFLAWLESMGPDSAAELAEVANMSDSELARFIELMNDAPEVATDAFKTKLGDGMEDAVDNMVAIMDDGSQSLREQIESSRFDEIGAMIPEGMAGGIDDNAHKVEDATTGMAEDGIHAANTALGINSPSRVFKEIGSNVVEGLVLGISSGAGKVISAVQNMLNGVVQSSQQMFSQLTSNYNAGVMTIQNALSKLGPMTQNVMAKNTATMQNGARQQINIMQQLSRQMVQAFRQTPQQLGQLAQQAMQLMNLERGKLALNSSSRLYESNTAPIVRH